MPPFMNEDIENRFAYHPPKNDTIKRQHEQIRVLCKDLAHELNNLFDHGSREASLALTHLEEVMFWANAHIARG